MKSFSKLVALSLVVGMAAAILLGDWALLVPVVGGLAVAYAAKKSILGK